MRRPLRKTSECRSPLSERWLAAQPPAATLPGLQDQLDTFRDHYNEHRPSRALQRSTPGQAYRALPKAAPADTASVTVIELRTGKSRPPTTSTQPAPTGATSRNARADGPGRLSPKSRLRRHLCRDSRHRAVDWCVDWVPEPPSTSSARGAIAWHQCRSRYRRTRTTLWAGEGLRFDSVKGLQVTGSVRSGSGLLLQLRTGS